MHDRDASNYVYAFVVLAFAGSAGLVKSIDALRAGNRPDLAFLGLTLLSLPAAIALGWRIATIIYCMTRSSRLVERRIALLWLSAMLCGLSGAVVLTLLTSDAGALLDSRNDWLVYSGFSLFGMAYLLAFVGGVILGLRRTRL